MRRWLKNYGFATLVMAGAVAAIYAAATVAVPDPVPDFALKAREIYQLEVGMAFFVASGAFVTKQHSTANTGRGWMNMRYALKLSKSDR